MGCYGIGVSRLLAAIVEHGCTFDEERIQWPPFLAPFFVCIVPLTTSQASYRSGMNVPEMISSTSNTSLIPRPETARRKGPGFHCLRMR